MRAVIYARYSCDNQRDESIECQLRKCREFAARKGYTLFGSYIDRAVSAKTDNRPEFAGKREHGGSFAPSGVGRSGEKFGEYGSSDKARNHIIRKPKSEWTNLRHGKPTMRLRSLVRKSKRKYLLENRSSFGYPR